MNNSRNTSNYNSEIRSDNRDMISSPQMQAQLGEKRTVYVQRPTYGFQFVSDFDAQRYGDLKEEFEFADLNKNGTLSRKEMEDYLANKMKTILNEYRPDFVDDLFNKMDENYDGTITLEEFSHFYYRNEDDFSLRMKHLIEENEDLTKKKTSLEADLRTSVSTKPSSHIQLNIIQGNFYDLKLSSSEIKNMKLRIMIEYNQGKDKVVEQNSRTIFSTLNPIWNDQMIFDVDNRENINFSIRLEQMEKMNKKLEKKKEFGRFNLSFQSTDQIPNSEQILTLFDATNPLVRVGSVQITFEYIHNQTFNKENLIRNIKTQIEENIANIKQIDIDYKYLQKLFGTIPKIPKPEPTDFEYPYSFFDNFNLIYQTIDKYTPKLGFNIESNREYLAYWEIALFQHFPLMIFIFALIICFSRADFLTLFFCLQLLPYGKYEWLKFQFFYAKLILLLTISIDFFWLVFAYPEWDYSGYGYGILQGGHAMNCIVWILSLINFFIKILYEIFLIYIYHKVNHGYGYSSNLPEVKSEQRNKIDAMMTKL